MAASSPQQAAMKRAHQLITEALDTLDAASVPPQITAHLELALAELSRAINQT